MSTRTGVMLHGAFSEEGGSLGDLVAGLEPFSSEDFNRVYRAVSQPVRFHGVDVRRIMDDGDIGPIEQARGGWFPEREFGLFFDGWVAVPVRMRSCKRYLQAYRGTDQVHDVEEVIFGFFANAVAAFDSFCFALYAMGSMLNPINFPSATDKQRKGMDGPSTEKRFHDFYGATNIAKLLPRIRGSDEYAALASIRNLLAHRASPVFSSRPDQPVASTWMIRGHYGRDVEFSPEVMAGEELWVREALSSLLVATADFAETQWEYRRRRASNK